MPSWKKIIISGSDAAIPSVSTANGDFTIDASGDIVLDADGADIVLKDGGTHFGSIKRVTSDLVIKSETSDKDIKLKGNDGGATITALQLDMSDAGSAIFNHDVKVNDNGKLKAGSGNDFQMTHDATNSYLINSTGHLYIQATDDDKDIVLQSDDGSGGVTAYLTLDGSATRIKVDKDLELQDSVNLKVGTSDDGQFYHDGSNTYLDNNTGNLYIRNNTDDGVILFQCDDGSGGVTDYIRINGNESLTRFKASTRHNDGIVAQFGSSNDMQIQHNGTNSFIENDTGDLYITNTADDKDILFQSDNGSGGTTNYFYLDGSQTKTVFAQSTQHADNAKAGFGAAHDLEIWHDGSNSYIENEVGDLQIYNKANDKDVILSTDDGSGGTTAYITLDGSATTVEISKTTNVDGTLTATGDVVAFYSSDKRLKDNIIRIENPLEKIKKIGGYEFDWNDKQKTYEGHDIGVIAQEIQEVLPEVVTERDNGYLAVKYEKIVPLLIESIKELKQEVDEIKQKCDCLNK